MAGQRLCCALRMVRRRTVGRTDPGPVSGPRPVTAGGAVGSRDSASAACVSGIAEGTSIVGGPQDAQRALVRRCLALAAGALIVLGLGVAGPAPRGSSIALAVLSGPQLVGGFEIDGAFPAGTHGLGGSDWSDAANTGPGLVSGPAVVDLLGHADTTNFAQGAKESQDPDTWHAQAGTAPPKADIGNVYEADRLFGGHRWVYLGLERAAADGTVLYHVELDQHANHANPHGVAVPSRSPGDLLFVIAQHGNGAFTFGATVQTWSCPNPAACNATGSWGTASDAGSAFYGLANDVAIATGP